MRSLHRRAGDGQVCACIAMRRMQDNSCGNIPSRNILSLDAETTQPQSGCMKDRKSSQAPLARLVKSPLAVRTAKCCSIPSMSRESCTCGQPRVRKAALHFRARCRHAGTGRPNRLQELKMEEQAIRNQQPVPTHRQRENDIRVPRPGSPLLHSRKPDVRSFRSLQPEQQRVPDREQSFSQLLSSGTTGPEPNLGHGPARWPTPHKTGMPNGIPAGTTNCSTCDCISSQLPSLPDRQDTSRLWARTEPPPNSYSPARTSS